MSSLFPITLYLHLVNDGYSTTQQNKAYYSYNGQPRMPWWIIAHLLEVSTRFRYFYVIFNWKKVKTCQRKHQRYSPIIKGDSSDK